MFLPWTDFLTFLVNNLNDLLETEIAQVRYGDVGLGLCFADRGIPVTIPDTKLIRNIKRAFGFVRFIRCPNCVLVAL